MDEASEHSTPIHWSELPAEDARAIRAAVEAMPQWQQEIFALFRREDGSFVLHLGTQTGPFSGGGDVVLATLTKSGWRLERTGFWVL